jgi:hypothetical protein
MQQGLRLPRERALMTNGRRIRSTQTLAVFASAAKQSSVSLYVSWIASLRSQRRKVEI